MKKETRFLILLLSFIMAAQAASCGNTSTASDDTTPADDTTTAAENVDPNSVLALPEMDWKGRQFRVMGVRDDTYPQLWNTFEIDAEAENGDVVNDSVFRRNMVIEDKYNVEIVELYYDDGYGKSHTNLTRSILANEDLHDLVFIAMNKCGPMAREGYFYDLNKVDYIDFTKKWWSKSANDALEYDGKLFFASSDFALRDKSRSGFLTYNREMIERYKLENPVDLVREGTWTLDNMLQMIEDVSTDLNGNTKVDEDDSFGLGFGSVHATAFFLITGAQNFTTVTDSTGKLVLNVVSDRALTTIDKLMKATVDPAQVMMVNHWTGETLTEGDPNTLAHRTFYKGNMLFVGSFADTLKDYSTNCDFEYGMLPNPKFDEAQEKYYSYADPESLLMSIPVTCPDPDFTGFMLEALSEASTETTKKAYLETVCRVKYVVDQESAEMLDIALSNVIYDPAVIFNITGIKDIWTQVMGSNKNTLASAYASIKEAAEADIVKISEDFAKFE